jgi:hypothetical protein
VLQASGEQGELWWVADLVRAEVPLVSEDGWEWVPRENSLSWWATVPLVLDSEAYVRTEPVQVPAAHVTTKQCLRGHALTALVFLHPLSLAFTAPLWELHIETRVTPQTMGSEPRTEPLSTGGVLRGLEPDPAFTLACASQRVLGRLRQGRMAFQGLCTVRPGVEGLSLLFPDGVTLS